MIDAVIDASVVVPWTLRSNGPLLDVLLETYACSTVDVLFSEVANGLWVGVHANQLAKDDMQLALRQLTSIPCAVSSSRLLLPRALDLALALDHPVYDCLYLALALMLNCQLYTADKTFVRHVKRSPWKEHIVLA